MKTELVTISCAVLAGALTRGATGVLLESAGNTAKMGVNIAGCAGFGFLATKVTGTDTKAAMLRGSAFGASIAHGLQFLSNIASTEKVAAKLQAEGKVNSFLAKAAGLSSPEQGLAGYIDADGNYHEDGLAGYIDAQGNFIEDGLNAYGNQDELVSYEEYQEEAEGLQAAIDLDGNIIM